MSIRTSCLQYGSVLYTIPLLVFCLPVPLITARGMLKSPTFTVHLSVSYFRSVSFCFIRFQAHLFGTYPFRVVCLPVNWPSYHYVLPLSISGNCISWEICFVPYYSSHSSFLLKVPACSMASSCLTLCDPVDCSPPGSSIHGDFPHKNTRMGSHALLQGIFLTQGSNPNLLCLLHWQAGSLPLVLPGKSFSSEQWYIYIYIYIYIFPSFTFRLPRLLYLK